MLLRPSLVEILQGCGAFQGEGGFLRDLRGREQVHSEAHDGHEGQGDPKLQVRIPPLA